MPSQAAEPRDEDRDHHRGEQQQASDDREGVRRDPLELEQGPHRAEEEHRGDDAPDGADAAEDRDAAEQHRRDDCAATWLCPVANTQRPVLVACSTTPKTRARTMSSGVTHGNGVPGMLS